MARKELKTRGRGWWGTRQDLGFRATPTGGPDCIPPETAALLWSSRRPSSLWARADFMMARAKRPSLAGSYSIAVSTPCPQGKFTVSWGQTLCFSQAQSSNSTNMHWMTEKWGQIAVRPQTAESSPLERWAQASVSGLRHGRGQSLISAPRVGGGLGHSPSEGVVPQGGPRSPSRSGHTRLSSHAPPGERSPGLPEAKAPEKQEEEGRVRAGPGCARPPGWGRGTVRSSLSRRCGTGLCLWKHL